MSKEPYNRIDHNHCWQSDESPCGIKEKHRCCLCAKEVPNNEEMEWKYNSIWQVLNSGNPIEEKYKVLEKLVERLIKSK